MKTVEEGLRDLYSKILSLHEKIDPNLYHEYYANRFKSFHQPQLIIQDILFVFESLSEKVEQLINRCPATEYVDRIERLFKKQEEQIKKKSKHIERDIKLIGKEIMYTQIDQSKRNLRLSIDLDRGLQEKDLNLAGKRTSVPKRHRSNYATKFDFGKVTPRMKPFSRQPPEQIQRATISKSPINIFQQNSPFEDSWIYHHIKTQNPKVNRRSLALKDYKNKRNSKNFSISIIKNSLKVC